MILSHNCKRSAQLGVLLFSTVIPPLFRLGDGAYFVPLDFAPPFPDASLPVFGSRFGLARGSIILLLPSSCNGLSAVSSPTSRALPLSSCPASNTFAPQKPLRRASGGGVYSARLRFTAPCRPKRSGALSVLLPVGRGLCGLDGAARVMRRRIQRI